MKVLTIVYDLGPGGTQRAAQNFSIAYKEKGFDVKVLGSAGLGPRTENLTKFSIECLDAKIDTAVTLSKLKNWSPDIIHLHRAGNPDPYLIDLVKSIKTQNTIVLETNVFSYFDDTSDGDEIDVHLHLSEYCLWKWYSTATFFKKSPQAAIIPYFVDCAPFYKVDNAEIVSFKNKYQIPLDKFIVGRIGQPSLAKWDPNIFNIVEKSEKNTHFVFIGAPKEYKDLANHRNVSIKITFIDFIHGDDNLRAAYNSFDIFLLMAIFGESFGMVLAESLLCQVPVICLSTPRRDNSQTYVVPHEIAGYVCNNENALLSSINFLSNNPAKLAELGQKGRHHVLTNFSKDILIKDLLKVIQSHKQKELPKIELNTLTKKIRAKLKNSYGTFSIKDFIFFLMPLTYMKLLYFISNRLRKN